MLTPSVKGKVNAPARKQAATSLDQILHDVLLYQEDSPVVLALEESKTNSQGKLTFLHDDKASKQAMFAHEVEDCVTLQSKCLNILHTTVTLFDSGMSDCDVDGSENKVDIIAPTLSLIHI